MTASFPTTRLRRLRRTPALRAMQRETVLRPADLIAPLFIQHGSHIRHPIPSMPGQMRLSVDQLAREAGELQALGLPAVLLFGIPATKDPIGQENFAPDGIIQQAIRALKAAAPDLVVITDVCLCEYTSHGHCGLLNEAGEVLNDATLAVLQQVAISHAAAGADMLAPSGMMDGMVGAMRTALDGAGYTHTPILSYAVKYASGFYGPFREAAEGAPQFGDRQTHQMDPANAREAGREAALDVAEGADWLMVKPALPYLDIIYRLRQAFPDMPLAAYQVSGEYAMLKAAASQGWLEERRVALESLMGIKRAGADVIITYYAREAAGWLRSSPS